MILNARAERNLIKVHPDLVRVVRLAAKKTAVDFTITCGARTYAEQVRLFEIKATRTMNSRHLIAPNGFSHAVDLAAMLGTTIRWDWPLYAKLAVAMKAAANELAIPITWGGDWKSFKDGPHFELPWATYPGKK